MQQLEIPGSDARSVNKIEQAKRACDVLRVRVRRARRAIRDREAKLAARSGTLRERERIEFEIAEKRKLLDGLEAEWQELREALQWGSE